MTRTVDPLLAELRRRLLRMGSLAEAILEKSLRALWARDAALAAEVQEDDVEIDRLDVEIDEAVLRVLALQAPVADDLRHVVAVKMIATDLERVVIDPDDPPLEALAAIDGQTLDLRRDEDHRWLAGQRRGLLYRRGGRPVAYGYHPTRPAWGGPYAALDARDIPVLLADGEASAARAGHPTVTFDVPMRDRRALDHLLARGFRVDPFVMLFFTDGPVDGLDRYVLTSPPFFA